MLHGLIRSTFIKLENNDKLHVEFWANDFSNHTRSINTKTNKKKFFSQLEQPMVLANGPLPIRQPRYETYDVLRLYVVDSTWYQPRIERIISEHDDELTIENEPSMETVQDMVSTFLGNRETSIYQGAQALVAMAFTPESPEYTKPREVKNTGYDFYYEPDYIEWFTRFNENYEV